MRSAIGTPHMTPRMLAPVALAAAALAGCGGQSSQGQAQSKVCDARADIAKQVDSLQALAPQTFSVETARSSLQAIRQDLSTIKDAQGDLNDDRRKQVQDANQAFASQVRTLAGQVVGGSLSTADAKTQITSAFDQLAGTYRQTLAKVDCS